MRWKIGLVLGLTLAATVGASADYDNSYTTLGGLVGNPNASAPYLAGDGQSAWVDVTGGNYGYFRDYPLAFWNGPAGGGTCNPTDISGKIMILTLQYETTGSPNVIYIRVYNDDPDTGNGCAAYGGKEYDIGATYRSAYPDAWNFPANQWFTVVIDLETDGIIAPNLPSGTYDFTRFGYMRMHFVEWDTGVQYAIGWDRTTIQDDAAAACCFPDGSCSESTILGCFRAGASSWEVGETCTGITCPDLRGACCFAETGYCTGPMVDYLCAQSGGSFFGPGTDCDPNPCPQPPHGACCLDDGNCQDDVSEYDCWNTYAGLWQGADTLCAQVTCERRGACCLPGRCCLSPVSESDCAAQSGTFMGPYTDCNGALCPGDVTIDFEDPRYVLGDVAGQECWVLRGGSPPGTAVVITGDSGPSGAVGDSQCLELSNAAGDIRVDRLFQDVIGNGGPVVTYQYDRKAAPIGGWFFDSSPEGPWMPSWWEPAWTQWWGSSNHDKSDGSHWCGGINDPVLNDGQWHTLTYKLVYGDPDGENSGELLSMTVDGTEYPVLNFYKEDDTPVSFFDVQLGTGSDGARDDMVRVDNYVVIGEPYPSVPTADAGADGALSFGDVLTLDASVSSTTNGATLTRYRWMALTPGQLETAGLILYDGPDAVVDICAGFTGSYTFLLQVFDSNGMRDTDTAEWTIGPAALVNPIIIDFEPASGYTPGPLIGQDCWTGGGAGTSTVISENGPTFPGEQCADLTNIGYSGQMYKAEKSFGDLLADGPLVMFQYDYLGYTEGWACLFFPQLTGMVPDGQSNNAGIGHWHTNWAQWMGSSQADGGGDWNNWGYPFDGWGQWHTFRWVLHYSPDEGGIGRLVYLKVDDNDPVVPGEYPYMRNTMVDIVDKCMLTITDGWDGNNDEVKVDNIVVRSRAYSELAACCLPNGTCADMAEGDCVAAGGLFKGIGNLCANDWLGNPVDCPDTGACCMSDGTCENLTVVGCNARGGITLGEGSDCAFAPPCTGACCLTDSSCEVTSIDGCAALEGMFMDLWSDCYSVVCPQPGWCCLPTGCIEVMYGLCEQQGGIAGPENSLCVDSVCPPNDACANATLVAVPSSTDGSTVYATNEQPEPPVCDGTSPDMAPGVWYKVVGTGNTMTASACNSASPYDQMMAVYCDDCDNFACVAGGDDTCGQGGGLSQASWCSRAGANYLIRVYGWSGATGDFTLDVSDDATPCTSTDSCEAAPQTGACCVGETCTEVTEAECTAASGVFQGVGSTCTPSPCACYGDADCSGAVDFDDINYFVAALAGGEPGWISYYRQNNGGVDPPCTFANTDANGDGATDFDDINPFVGLLVDQKQCPERSATPRSD